MESGGTRIYFKCRMSLEMLSQQSDLQDWKQAEIEIWKSEYRVNVEQQEWIRLGRQ
jgi:hypothetical protein